MPAHAGIHAAPPTQAPHARTKRANNLLRVLSSPSTSSVVHFPFLDRRRASPMTTLDHQDRGGPAQPMLIATSLKKHFPLPGGGAVRAVDDVSFTVGKGETLGVVGESGCGKSTLARLLLHLIQPDSGELVFDGEEVGTPRGIDLKSLRRQAQMVFQDSASSLNPRMPVRDSVAFGPLVLGRSKRQAAAQADETLRRVGLDPELFGPRYPHELSGGQKQRVNIARALALEPRLVILDEAVSALDKSVEAQVLNLLAKLKRDLGLTYVFISHDLAVVRHVSDRVLVMYLGCVAESGPAEDVFANPLHPYTQALLASRLSMDPDARVDQAPITGDPPSPANPPSGCRFRTRCPHAEQICADKPPTPPTWQGHQAACHMLFPASGHSQAKKPSPVGRGLGEGVNPNTQAAAE